MDEAVRLPSDSPRKQEGLSEALRPCPFCGEQPQEIKANGGTWNGGMRPPQPPVSYDVIHWCPRVEGQPSPRQISRCGKSREDAIAAWNARKEGDAHRSQAPEGFVLVPVEPTEEMVAAAVERLGLPWREIQRCMEAYRVMLAAAPAPPRQEADGRVRLSGGGGRRASADEPAQRSRPSRNT